MVLGVTLTAILIEQSDDFLKLFRSKYGLQFHIFEWASRISGRSKERQFIQLKDICENLVNLC